MHARTHAPHAHTCTHIHTINRSRRQVPSLQPDLQGKVAGRTYGSPPRYCRRGHRSIRLGHAAVISHWRRESSLFDIQRRRHSEDGLLALDWRQSLVSRLAVRDTNPTSLPAYTIVLENADWRCFFTHGMLHHLQWLARATQWFGNSVLLSRRPTTSTDADTHAHSTAPHAMTLHPCLFVFLDTGTLPIPGFNTLAAIQHQSITKESFI